MSASESKIHPSTGSVSVARTSPLQARPFLEDCADGSGIFVLKTQRHRAQVHLCGTGKERRGTAELRRKLSDDFDIFLEELHSHPGIIVIVSNHPGPSDFQHARAPRTVV